MSYMDGHAVYIFLIWARTIVLTGPLKSNETMALETQVGGGFSAWLGFQDFP